MGAPKVILEGLRSRFYLIITVPDSIEKIVAQALIDNKYTHEPWPCRYITMKRWKIHVTIKRAYMLQRLIDNICEQWGVQTYD